MRKLLIFILLIIGVLSSVNITPVNLDNYLKQTIKVEIKGAVLNPGIYDLPLYTSLQELFNEAILLENADISSFNESLILQDHDVVNVPIVQEKKLVSINSAKLEELCTLPGIKEKTALLIIEYRNNQLFKSIDEIMNVKGIGPAKFEKIKDYIAL